MPPNVKPNHDHHNDTLALLQRLTLSDYPARRPTKLVKRMSNMDTSDSPAIDQIATHSHTPNLQQHKQAPPSNLSFTTSTTPTARPGPPSRSASYSKRHASFDTPREIPLPSPSASEGPMAQYFPFIAPNASTAPRRNSQKSVSTDGQQDSHMGELLAGKEDDDVYMREMGIMAERDRYAAVFEDGYDSASMLSGSSGSSSGSPAPSIAPSELSLRHQKACGSPRVRPYPPPQLHAHGEEGSASKGKGKELEKDKEAGQVFPFSRPYSLPHNHSSSSNSSTSTQTGMPAPTPSGLGGDRSSTASLPLPKQTPFRTLPTVNGSQAQSPMQEEPPIELSLPPIEQSQPEPPLHLRPQTQPAAPRPRALDAPVPSSFTIPPLPVPQRRSRPQAVSSAAASSSTTLLPATAYPHGAMSRSLSVDPEVAAPYSGAPEPPTILSEAANAPSRTPFLCAQPLAVEHAVTVETARNAYTLLIRLPGFRRDAITLASRKRRVLHVVADDWTPGSGGHFERKVSFGWDAELGSVRAEFDGEVLRVVVPRRVPQVW